MTTEMEPRKSKQEFRVLRRLIEPRKQSRKMAPTFRRLGGPRSQPSQGWRCDWVRSEAGK